MTEYEHLFSKSLFDQLKTRVKGHVFCKVVNDILVVSIDTKEGIDYGYTMENFAHELSFKGLEAEPLAEMIVKEYRKELLRKFLY
jgi:hypothetical protein